MDIIISPLKAPVRAILVMWVISLGHMFHSISILLFSVIAVAIIVGSKWVEPKLANMERHVMERTWAKLMIIIIHIMICWILFAQIPETENIKPYVEKYIYVFMYAFITSLLAVAGFVVAIIANILKYLF
jgi:hypothetical protein